jgi:hypothetical protein
MRNSRDETASISFGGGDLAGPDLIRATQLSPSDVRAAIHRLKATSDH